MGLSVGSSVTVAQYYGAGEHHHVSEVVHTSVATSIVTSIIVSIFGISMAEKLLAAMGTPPDVLGQATLYLRIYFSGMPASMLFNYGSSILRAVGDTKRPLLYLSISGILNVVLNLILVIFFRMGVARGCDLQPLSATGTVRRFWSLICLSSSMCSIQAGFVAHPVS